MKTNVARAVEAIRGMTPALLSRLTGFSADAVSPPGASSRELAELSHKEPSLPGDLIEFLSISNGLYLPVVNEFEILSAGELVRIAPARPLRWSDHPLRPQHRIDGAAIKIGRDGGGYDFVQVLPAGEVLHIQDSTGGSGANYEAGDGRVKLIGGSFGGFLDRLVEDLRHWLDDDERWEYVDH